MGVSLAEGQWWNALEAFGLIVLFVAGAAVGSLIVLGRAQRQAGLLLVEALLLAGAGLAHHFGYEVLAVAAIVLAMGLENAVFQIDGGSGLGLTYVTGALVKVGQLLAAAMTGGPRWVWVPNLLLCAALVAGAVLGALGYKSFNLGAIWIAACIAFALAVMVAAGAKRPD